MSSLHNDLATWAARARAGDAQQEVGGVMVTLAALCLANELDVHEAAETELQRIWTKVEAIRAKQAAKPRTRRCQAMPSPLHHSGSCSVIA
ncbi:MAG: hypothetical protein AAAC48_14685 [Phyllobacterium sp.]|uniref:hypothetical protein n=1 Tax=Phyllobacterium sp. TaxID=1871046 RepID=UPI0030F22C17